MTLEKLAEVSDLEPGDRIIVTSKGKEICIFRTDETFRAYLNWCPHQSGPVCEGVTTGTYEASYDAEKLEMDLEWVKDGEVLNCPWHGWEFDVLTGDCLSREKIKLVEYPVEIDGNDILVDI